MATNFGLIDYAQANKNIPVVTYGIPKGATPEKPEGVNIKLNRYNGGSLTQVVTTQPTINRTAKGNVENTNINYFYIFCRSGYIAQRENAYDVRYKLIQKTSDNNYYKIELLTNNLLGPETDSYRWGYYEDFFGSNHYKNVFISPYYSCFKVTFKEVDVKEFYRTTTLKIPVLIFTKAGAVYEGYDDENGSGDSSTDDGKSYRTFPGEPYTDLAYAKFNIVILPGDGKVKTNTINNWYFDSPSFIMNPYLQDYANIKKSVVCKELVKGAFYHWCQTAGASVTKANEHLKSETAGYICDNLPLSYNNPVIDSRYWTEDFVSLKEILYKKNEEGTIYPDKYTELKDANINIQSVLVAPIYTADRTGVPMTHAIKIYNNKANARSGLLKGEAYCIVSEPGDAHHCITEEGSSDEGWFRVNVQGEPWQTNTVPAQYGDILVFAREDGGNDKLSIPAIYQNLLLVPTEQCQYIPDGYKVTITLYEVGDTIAQDTKILTQEVTFFNKSTYKDVTNIWGIPNSDKNIEDLDIRLDLDDKPTLDILDTGEGQAYSSTSLLFKNNKANIYQTIEAKDNTLFAGNYRLKTQESDLYKTVEKYMNSDQDSKETVEFYKPVMIHVSKNDGYPEDKQPVTIKFNQKCKIYGISVLPFDVNYRGSKSLDTLFKDNLVKFNLDQVRNGIEKKISKSEAEYDFQSNSGFQPPYPRLVTENKNIRYYENTEGQYNAYFTSQYSIESTDILKILITMEPDSAGYYPNRYEIYIFAEPINDSENIIEVGDSVYPINTVSEQKEVEVKRSFSFWDSFKKIPLNVNESDAQYNYVPNLELSSRDKRIFKNGEQYTLGIVFVYQDGTRSNIYHLDQLNDNGKGDGEWIPLTEPVVNKSSDGSYFYTKEVKVCEIPPALSSLLRNQYGIIGAIPVYLPKENPRIICQGILNNTVNSVALKNSTSVDARYDWFYRERLSPSNNPLSVYNDADFTSNFDIEIQSQDSPQGSDPIKSVSNIYTFNTPEIELADDLTNANVEGAQYRHVNMYRDLIYTNDVEILYNGANRLSSVEKGDIYQGFKVVENQSAMYGDNPVSLSQLTTQRFKSGFLWFGFALNGETSRDEAIKHATNLQNLQDNYAYFKVYPWQRNRLGSEVGDGYTIKAKRYFSQMYSPSCTINPVNTPTASVIAQRIDSNWANSIYRITTNKDNIRESMLYAGTTDIVLADKGNTNKTYSLQAVDAFAKEGNLPNRKTIQTGADPSSPGYLITIDGITGDKCKDAISMRYKTASHAVLAFSTPYGLSTNHSGITVGELYNPNDLKPVTEYQMQLNSWIPCGDLKRLESDRSTYVVFEEGDFFFCRYDSLRTEPYSQDDVNQVTDIVSVMLCSRINLDARTDSNRGVKTPTVTSQNFNQINPVYNQVDNYFNYTYQDSLDISYNRNFANTLQYSLPKYSGELIDTWCNIQDSNFLDLDGDKGALVSINKLGNNIVAFQDMGISLILYNEKTQLATNAGVPIEIANSGKVDGKKYIYNNIGCQNIRAIQNSPSGAYFVDAINKGLYFLSPDLNIQNLTVSGLNAWSKHNIDANWWTYYDSISNEVMFINDQQALLYSEPYKKFISFASYGGIKHQFRIADSIMQICPPTLEQTIDMDQVNGYDIAKTRVISNDYSTLWKKNSIEDTCLFGNKVGYAIEWICAPAPQNDKTFTTIDYRADSFYSDGYYIDNDSFTSIRVQTEYQDTQEVPLKWETNTTSNLKKKFRVWHVDIPRVQEFNASTEKYELSKDRIRNMWCKITLKHNNEKGSTPNGKWRQISKNSALGSEALDKLGDIDPITEEPIIKRVTRLPQEGEEGDLVVLCIPGDDGKPSFSVLGIYTYHTNHRFVFYDTSVNYIL